MNRYWLQLRLPASQAQQAHLEAALFDCGAVSVSLEDAGDEAIFEAGATWSQGVLVALFDPDSAEADAIRQQLAEALPTLTTIPAFERVDEQDWVALTQSQFPARAFGARLWIAPSWADAPADAPVLLRLDPGQAFGTGAHPTTELCLRWLDQTLQGGETVLDYGCGSGILAIAALLLGAERAYGVDNDPAALRVAAENARLNHVAERLWLGLPEDFEAAWPALQGDLVVANILAGPLQTLVETLARHCLPSGRLALSGILAEQAAAVATAYAPRFQMQLPMQQGDWVRLDGQRSHQ